MKRRSFFQALAKAAAIVALAPQIAFRTKPIDASVVGLEELTPHTHELTGFWYETSRYTMCTDEAYERWFKTLDKDNAYRRFQKA